MKRNILFRLSWAFMFICVGAFLFICIGAALGYDVMPYRGLFSLVVIGFLASAIGVGASSSKI